MPSLVQAVSLVPRTRPIKKEMSPSKLSLPKSLNSSGNSQEVDAQFLSEEDASENTSPIYRGRTNAFEILMSVRPDQSVVNDVSPIPKLQPLIGRVEPEDESVKIIARENKKLCREKLEKMTSNKNKQMNKSQESREESGTKKKRVIVIPESDSESEEVAEELADTKIDTDSDVKVGLGLTRSKRKVVVSDDDDDFQDVVISKKRVKNGKQSTLRQSKLKLEPIVHDVEKNVVKRNTLFNYFNTVNREDVVNQPDKIKVVASIHSPPTTPGKKSRPSTPVRLSTGRLSVSSQLQFDSCDRIDLLNSEVIDDPEPVAVESIARNVPKVSAADRIQPEITDNIEGMIETSAKTESIQAKSVPIPVRRSPRKSPIKATEKKSEKKPAYLQGLKLRIKFPSPASGSNSDTSRPTVKATDLSDDSNEKGAQSPTQRKKKTKEKSPVKTKHTPTVKASSIIKSPKKEKNPTSPSKSPTKRKTPVKVESQSPIKSHPKTKTSASLKVATKIKSPKTKTSSKLRLIPNEKKQTKQSSPLKADKATSKTVDIPSKSTSTRKVTTKLKSVKSAKTRSPSKVTKNESKSPAKDKTPTTRTYAKKDSGSSKVAVRSLKASVSSPKVAARSPKVAARSPKVAVSSRKTTVSSPKIAVSSPKIAVSSPKVAVSSSKAAVKSSKVSTISSKVPSSSKSATISTTKNASIFSASKKVKSSIKAEKVLETKLQTDVDSAKRQMRKRKPVETVVSSDDDDDIVVIESKVSKPLSASSKASTKFAPIFMKKTKFPSVVEIIEDPAVVAARMRFLQSGVPDCVKKVVDVMNRDDPEPSPFPTVAHVKQEDSSHFWNLPLVELELLPIDETNFAFSELKLERGSFTDRNLNVNLVQNEPKPPERIATYRNILQNFIFENPDYCVIRNFKRLKNKYLKSLPPKVEKVTEKASRRNSKRKREIEMVEEVKVAVADEMWTEKYKPANSEEVVGNSTAINQLKTWLESWKKFRNCDDPNFNSTKRKRGKSGSSDEFIDDDYSDSEDESSMPANTAMIFGPSGSGKTCAIYAIANELGYKVLEINASSKRTGKSLLKLQEATQSHRLCAVETEQASCAKLFKTAASEKKKKKKKKAEKPKPINDDASSTKMSLILVENADIVFDDEDEGFISTLFSLASSSKRPLIIVANDPRCPHLSRFYDQSLVIELNAPKHNELAIWLQLVALIEGVRISRDAIVKLLNVYRGDISRCLLTLQFWVLTGGNNYLRDADPNSVKTRRSTSTTDDDERSFLIIGEKVDELTPMHDECVELFVGNGVESVCPFPIDLTKLWWNLAPLLEMPQLVCRKPIVEQYVQAQTNEDKVNEILSEIKGDDEEFNIFDRLKKNKTVIVEEETVLPEIVPVPEEAFVWKSVCSQEELDNFSALADSLSTVDLLTSDARVNGDAVDAGPCPRVWQIGTRDGVAVGENLRPCWSQDERLSEEVVHWVTERCVARCRRSETDVAFDRTLPTEEVDRWRVDQQNADNTICSLVPAGCLPDHRAVFTDYLPTLRSICRAEDGRLATNTKRRNRFFHYLRNLGVQPTDRTLAVLCATFRDGLWKCRTDTRVD